MSPSRSLSASLNISLAVSLGTETFRNFQALLQRVWNSWAVIFLSDPFDILPALCMTCRLISAQCLWKRKLPWVIQKGYHLSKGNGSAFVSVQSEDIFHDIVDLLLGFFTEGGSDEFFDCVDGHLSTAGGKLVVDDFELVPKWVSERGDLTLHFN